MAKFLTIGYGDRAGYDRTPKAARDRAHREDAKLLSEDAVIGVAGQPTQVRNPEGYGVETTAGAFMSSGLPVAGFALIEAENMEEAIRKVSGVPCAVAHGVVEIWPLGQISRERTENAAGKGRNPRQSMQDRISAPPVALQKTVTDAPKPSGQPRET